jgi:hypothetical protein
MSSRRRVVIQFTQPEGTPAVVDDNDDDSDSASTGDAAVDLAAVLKLCAEHGLEAKIADKFAPLVLDESTPERAFATPTKNQRAAMGRVCAALGLAFETKGSGERQRFVMRGKASETRAAKQRQLEENEGSLTIACEKGYVSASGPAVERAAARFISAVPGAWVQNRQRRDGEHHHVTLLSKFDLQAISVSREEVLDMFRDALSAGAETREPFGVEGVGSVTEADGNTAVFVVLDFPELSQVRERLGLKARQDPHITLGFRRSDVHDVRKDATTLLPDESLDELSARLQKQLTTQRKK